MLINTKQTIKFRIIYSLPIIDKTHHAFFKSITKERTKSIFHVNFLLILLNCNDCHGQFYQYSDFVIIRINEI